MHIQDTKQTDNQHEIGGSLGGYFIKNKLYFFTRLSRRVSAHQSGTYKFSNGAETGTNWSATPRPTSCSTSCPGIR